MKKQLCILLAVLMLLSVCGAAFAEGVPVADKKEKADSKQAAFPDCILFENEGLILPVPDSYSALLTVMTPRDDEYGELFSVSETASIEAAEATGLDYDGAGWLFSISRVTEDELHQILCYYMFGSEVIARDEQGMYYLFDHPTDVRIVRESYDSMDEDIQIWSELNQWAWSAKDDFLSANDGLRPESRSNSDPEIYLSRAAWMDGEHYTVSTLEDGPREPGKTDPVPFVEKLTTNVYLEELDEGTAPDGEFVSLNMPEERLRLDFFLDEGNENLIRIVTDDGSESLWKAEYADGTTKAGEVMLDWYKALAA